MAVVASRRHWINILSRIHESDPGTDIQWLKELTRQIERAVDAE